MGQQNRGKNATAMCNKKARYYFLFGKRTELQIWCKTRAGAMCNKRIPFQENLRSQDVRYSAEIAMCNKTVDSFRFERFLRSENTCRGSESAMCNRSLKHTKGKQNTQLNRSHFRIEKNREPKNPLHRSGNAICNKRFDSVRERT